MEVQNTPKAKKQIYKGANPTSILDHGKGNQNEVKRTLTNNINSYIKIKNKKHTKFTFSDFRISSPKNMRGPGSLRLMKSSSSVKTSCT